MIAAMIVGFKVDFAWLLQAVMHERAFKVTTTYPFPCMIFALCRYYLLWHPSKTEPAHAGDLSLSPRLPVWSSALMMSGTLNTCPQAPPPLPMLHVPLEPHLR